MTENMTNGKVFAEESGLNLNSVHNSKSCLADQEIDCSHVPSSSIGASSCNKKPSSNSVTVQVVVDYFKSLNLPKDSFKISTEKTKISELLRWLRSPPKLDENLKSEVDLVFSLTQCILLL